MNHSQDTYVAAWWEKELPILRQKQAAYLSRRIPAFRDEHEDLLNETLFALMKHIRKHTSSLPESWFDSNSTPSEAEKLRFHRLAMVILRRRIADLFRKRAPSSKVSIDDAPVEVADAHAASPARKVMLEKMFQVTRSILDEMNAKDRDLIALISEDVEFRTSLSPRERKRLQRIRKRLKDEIIRRLGAEFSDLLPIDL